VRGPARRAPNPGFLPAAAFALALVAVACGDSSPLGPNQPGEAERGRAVAGAAAARATPPPGAAPGQVVRVGLDVLDAEGALGLQGKKVGLVVNAASVTQDGRSAVDVLLRHGVEVSRLFSPEHGLLGRLAAGEKVGGGRDEASGLSVVSLYGDKTKPAPADLEGVQALVVDLQDAGVRFYTYVSTLLLCLEAAGEAGIELIVLDRPNPLGGERVEGPTSDSRADVPTSLVNMAPGPLVHGLTLGEMATYVNGRLEKPARLTVVAMKGWSRSMTWAATGRAWVAPSPNLRSAEAVLAYPGVCLLEATNVSEGRGTAEPFLLLGSPWTKAAEVVASAKAPGFELEPATFTPQASEAAPDPKHGGAACTGVRVKVMDAAAARPYELGIALLAALKTLHPEFAWRSEDALDRLLGTRRVRKELERGTSVAAIVQADAKAIEAWRRDRASALLY
jgi:beta-N-acetylhexosaminidase